MNNYRTLFKRPTDKQAKIIREFQAKNFHTAYVIARNSLLEDVRKEEKQPTLTLVMLAQLPK